MHEKSIDAFVTAFEQTLILFIDKKQEDYLKLKTMLLGRD